MYFHYESKRGTQMTNTAPNFGDLSNDQIEPDLEEVQGMFDTPIRITSIVKHGERSWVVCYYESRRGPEIAKVSVLQRNRQNILYVESTILVN
jgi:hypothetical protein